jgi:hypothetical protein
MGTKRSGTTSSQVAECYGIKINANDRANSRGSPSSGVSWGANSAATAYAEQLAAGSHTVQGRFSNNYSTYTAIIDARQVVALWFTIGAAYEKVLTESLGLLDLTVKGVSAVKSESLGLLDIYSRTWTAYRTYSEPLGLSDTASKDVSLHPLTEGLGLLDSLQKGRGKVLTESLGLMDTFSRTWSSYRTFSELLGLVDSLRKEPGKVLPEALGLKDAFSRTWAVQRTCTEALGLKDTVSKGIALHALTEVLGLIGRLSYCRNPTVISKIIRKLIQVENILGREADPEEINILKKIIKLYGEM